MSDDHSQNNSRRELLKRFVGAAVVASTSLSFVNAAAAAGKEGNKAEFKIKGGGVLQLISMGKDGWKAIVQDGGRSNEKATGLLILAGGKVVGLKDGRLALGQFGGSGSLSNFVEFVSFLEFVENMAGIAKAPILGNAVLPRQSEELRAMKMLKLGPKHTINLEKRLG